MKLGMAALLFLFASYLSQNVVLGVGAEQKKWEYAFLAVNKANWEPYAGTEKFVKRERR
jgi:hypothetical protein